jgi:hypothetical protein
VYAGDPSKEMFYSPLEAAMKWINREQVKVDRVACPWLIQKFGDPQAEFLFVPADKGKPDGAFK